MSLALRCIACAQKLRRGFRWLCPVQPEITLVSALGEISEGGYDDLGSEITAGWVIVKYHIDGVSYWRLFSPGEVPVIQPESAIRHANFPCLSIEVHTADGIIEEVYDTFINFRVAGNTLSSEFIQAYSGVRGEVFMLDQMLNIRPVVSLKTI